jgi:diguanylate cyclase (GGDEF)-like protein
MRVVACQSVPGPEPLAVAFQPIVQLITGEVVGYEALGRVAADATISPQTMLDRAHDESTLLDLDHAWRRLALEHVARHHAHDALTFFLNVDTRVVDDPRFAPGFTRRLCDELGVDPRRLVFELVEHDRALCGERIGRLLPHYTEQGFRIALDDVGAGYASLAAIVRLRPDILKLDKALVTGLGRDPVRCNLVSALADFGRRSGMRVVAEGIETAEDLRAVMRAGVDLGQGWLLARPAGRAEPLPADVVALVQQTRREVERGRIQTTRTKLVAELATPHPTVPPTLTGAELDERFRREPARTGFPVVDAAGQVVGLVTRDRFQAANSGRFGYALRSTRPIADLVDRRALRVEATTPLGTVSRLATSREALSLYDLVIVEQDGRYAGAVTVHALLEATTQLEIRHAAYASPLTGLPGNVVIEQRIQDALDSGEGAAVVYADLDHFKGYNDAYGFAAGDDVIRLAARLLSESFDAAFFARAFVGHVGGDDFVAVVSGGDVEAACARVAAGFDAQVRQHYAPADLERGGTVGTDRRGQVVHVPLCSLSMAIVPTQGGALRDVREVARAAAELKKLAKRRAAELRGSAWVVDRRRAPGASPATGG